MCRLSTNKVGHLYCRICVGIEVSNLLRILLSKFISKGSESTVGFVSNVCRDSDSIHDSDTLLMNLLHKFRCKFDTSIPTQIRQYR